MDDLTGIVHDDDPLFRRRQRWRQGQKCQGQGQDQGLSFQGQDQGQGLEFQGQGQGRQLPASRRLEVKATASRTPCLEEGHLKTPVQSSQKLT